MPRPSSRALNSAVAGLLREIRGLVGALEGAAAAALPVGPLPRKPGQRGAGKNNPKLRAALKRSWANYTPAQRRARVAKMLAGRGLKPKGAGKRPATRKPAARVVRPSAPKRESAWASMTAEQRAVRIAKMQAGRAAKPSTAPAAVASTS